MIWPSRLSAVIDRLSIITKQILQFVSSKEFDPTIAKNEQW